jgi:DNA-directed RNA polymerase subunit K/omega
MSYFDDNEKDNEKYPGSDDDDDDTNNNSDTDNDDDNVEDDQDAEEDLDEDLEEELEENDDEEDNGEAKGKDEDESDAESVNISENENEDDDEYQAKPVSKKKNVKTIIKKSAVNKAFIENLSDDDDDGDGETYLKKFDKEINDNYIVNNHPECALQNYDEILAMTKVVRDKNNIIIDDLHKTIPHLTKYERARILGQRAKQIETGATPFIKVPENVIDGYLIAEMELKQGRIPFIIRRPLPNGGSEYWKISDLENIAF